MKGETMKVLNACCKSKISLALLATRIQDILWFDNDVLDPDKQWDADTVEMIADQMEACGLKPEVVAPATIETPKWVEQAQARHPEDEWRREVAAGSTRLGYEDWCRLRERA